MCFLCDTVYFSSFFQAGNYQAAINAYTHAIRLNCKMPAYPCQRCWMQCNRAIKSSWCWWLITILMQHSCKQFYCFEKVFVYYRAAARHSFWYEASYFVWSVNWCIWDIVQLLYFRVFFTSVAVTKWIWVRARFIWLGKEILSWRQKGHPAKSASVHVSDVVWDRRS